MQFFISFAILSEYKSVFFSLKMLQCVTPQLCTCKLDRIGALIMQDLQMTDYVVHIRFWIFQLLAERWHTAVFF